MDKKLIIGIVLCSIVVAIVGLFMLYRLTPSGLGGEYVGKSPEECSRIQVTCVSGYERFDDNKGCGCRPTMVPESWKEYKNNTAGFSLRYDPTLTIQEDQDSNIRFFKWGPTQKGETEMYDGIILGVRRVAVSDGGAAHIRSVIEQFENVGRITDPLHESILNGLPVKKMSASGLGDFTLIFVPVGPSAILEISYMVPDPTGVGFQKTVDLILSTLRVRTPSDTSSEGKLNIDVVCQGALSYMTFPDGASAEKFVAECKEGKHPEVIENYKEQMNLGDGAEI